MERGRDELQADREDRSLGGRIARGRREAGACVERRRARLRIQDDFGVAARMGRVDERVQHAPAHAAAAQRLQRRHASDARGARPVAQQAAGRQRHAEPVVCDRMHAAVVGLVPFHLLRDLLLLDVGQHRLQHRCARRAQQREDVLHLVEPLDALQREFNAIGFYLSAHPLDAYSKTLQRLHVVPYVDLLNRMKQTGGNRFTMAGVLISKQERRSARGSKYAFAQFTDASGLFEVTLFSEVLSSSRELLEGGKPLVLTVDAELREEGLRLTVQSLADLEVASASADAALQIWLASPPPIDRVALALKESGKGRVQVSLMVDADNTEVRLDLPGRWAISAAVRGRLKTIAGVLDIREI